MQSAQRRITGLIRLLLVLCTAGCGDDSAAAGGDAGDAASGAKPAGSVSSPDVSCDGDPVLAPAMKTSEPCTAMNVFAHAPDLRGCDLASPMPTYLGGFFRGTLSYDLLSCPNARLPDNPPEICASQPNGRYAYVVPGVDLSGADLAGVDLSDAHLEGVRGVDLVSCPSALPAAIRCVPVGAGYFTLVGPKLDLSGADLAKADLTRAKLDDARTGSLRACPKALPDGYQCVALSARCAFAVVGPKLDLSEEDLRGADLSKLDLHASNFTNTNLTGVDLRDANLTGALLATDLADAKLDGAQVDGATVGGSSGCRASLPSDAFRCLGDAVVGPGIVALGELQGADLRGLDLAGADLAMTALSSAKAYGLVACPDKLAPEWRCIGPLDDGSFAIVGHGIDLRGADLRGAALDADDLSSARASELTGCAASLPKGFVCAAQPTGTHAIVGPRIDAQGVDLANADLSSAELWEAVLDDASLLGALLDGVDLGAASLRGTNLKNASLVGANFSESAYDNFEGKGADLAGADLTQADLRGASFINAILSGAALAGASLNNAKTFAIGVIDRSGCPASLPSDWQCVAEGAINGHALVGPGADLRNANFDYEDLKGVNFTDVSLADASFVRASVAGAIWSNTTCPDGSNSDANGNTCAGHLSAP